ncbi:tetratricopeptide repeat protein [Leptospira meyeri]|uniref:Tetratricopeptide repeat protein n=3 Tax=Leptospiraceae TaxID=170 RepID=A0A4R8MNI0_LEPME|nr:tetratricopeptide repeat protein [Leptospira wolbachii serovar Codice str. CDC]TDY66367.1 tetratricopeptide repeat protein [Leptospira meyeri]
MRNKDTKFQIYLTKTFITIILFALVFCKNDEREVEALKLKQLFDEGNYIEVIKYSEILMKKYPSSKSGYLIMISVAYQQLGNLEMTKFYIKKAIELDNSQGENYANLGVIYFNEKNYKDSLPYLLEGLEKGGYKDPCALVYAIGLCYSELKDVNNAAGAFLSFLSRCENESRFIEQIKIANMYLFANKEKIEIR